ncbi:serine--tRNA ligase [Methanobacterium petrolearium]|uniref:serine--tRNA ligase n=1 Tax=Methanobacterium petrolearium TaxID=710190 RepID=UPI001AE6CD5E|nr:serine--tRNA ligase [Methanobacterium petrolearium]MBP1945823.1 seryl-tRNA synthetase [Methanobacterium petrolearium]BDZ69627.1 serine--tRNA ligase [Methanobacterium petrolearium]
MKFTLEGEILLSKDADDALDDIAGFVEEANNELFLKGIPKDQESDASHIVEWNLSGKNLHLKIVSGRRGRAHDALLRIKKPLTQLLGPKYHVGVRKMSVKNYHIEIPSPEMVDVSQMPYVDEALFHDDKMVIKFKKLKEGDLRNHVVDRVIKQVLAESEKTASQKESDEDADDILTRKVTKIEPGTIIGRSPKFPVFSEGDPTEKAVKQGWVKKFPGKGQWFYGPQFITLQRAIEDIFLEVLAEQLEFYECMWPKLIPIPVMNKMRYLEGLPEGMYYCSAPRRDPEVFKKFKTELLIKKEVPIDRLKDGLKDPSYVLAPAQCEPFYEFFSHEVLDEKDLPIKLFDKSGWTYRWEAGGAKGLDRVHEFQRTELVWLGLPEQVEEIRDATLNISQDLANQMELEWYTEIGDDPFYLEGRKVEERGIEFPDVPKYEMRLVVPGADKGVAAVSANVHGTHFTEGFSIKETHNHTLWTGCTGIGTTRWLFGFLAQKGFDESNWPDMVRDRVKTVRAPRVLTWP